jgi:hypothetical protein
MANQQESADEHHHRQDQNPGDDNESDNHVSKNFHDLASFVAH